jgi:hypothetical protein
MGISGRDKIGFWWQAAGFACGDPAGDGLFKGEAVCSPISLPCHMRQGKNESNQQQTLQY